MTNNEKLNQIISNVQALNALASSMTNAEIYPVSFFSKAFDLLQKIQSDVHTLEAGQVEMFETQMKKHRELILSIHRQTMNIADTSEQTLAVVSEPCKRFEQGEEGTREQTLAVVSEPCKRFEQGDEETSEQTLAVVSEPCKRFEQGDEGTSEQTLAVVSEPCKRFEQGDEETSEQTLAVVSE
ncbi:MAG: hypothetical protein LBD53_04790, partial [Tannerella sp.]|nr:hypothetical protein [Tannerella sp.]